MPFVLRKTISENQLQIFSELNSSLGQKFQQALCQADYYSIFNDILSLNIDQEEFAKLYEFIEQWDVKALNFKSNLYVLQILQIKPQFAHIKFRNLQILNLDHNQLASIEWIGFMDMPSLQILNLSQNKIKSLKSLTKVNFKNLKQLNLDNFQVGQSPLISTTQIQNLSRLNLGPIDVNKSVKGQPSFSEIQKIFPQDSSNSFRYISTKGGYCCDFEYVAYFSDLYISLSMAKFKVSRQQFLSAKINIDYFEDEIPKKISKYLRKRFV